MEVQESGAVRGAGRGAKRVLLVATNVGREVEMQAYVASALKQLGCRTDVFDYALTRVVPQWVKRLIPGRWRARASPRRLPAVEEADTALANRALLAACERLRPTLVVFLRGERITPETIEAIRARGAIVVNWSSDHFRALLPPEPLRAFSMAFDAWFVADQVCAEQLGTTRHLEFLPLACDPQVHRPVALSAGDRRAWGSRICFVGGHTPDREPYLAAIADLGLAIWGPRWERTRDAAVRRCVRAFRYLAPEEWTRAFAATQIIVNIHRDYGYPYQGISMKCFETLACGAFLLCDWKAKLIELFGDRVPTFRSPEELRSRCEYFLAHPEARERYREELRTMVVSEHTYVHRVRAILKTVERLRDQRVRGA